MLSNVHRLNCDFQLAHFLAGSCTTPDGAWALLYGQRLDMQSKIAHGKTRELLMQAKRARVDQFPANSPEWFEAQAALVEAEETDAIYALNLEGARRELQSIEALMAELEPQCKYAGMENIHERLEACKREEWAGELMRRAENMLLGNLIGIPYDHVATMRQHPDFAEKILPHLMEVGAAVKKAVSTNSVKDIERALLEPASRLKLVHSKAA